MDSAAPKRITKEFLAAVARQPLALAAAAVVPMAKDQHGCRFLQKRLDELAGVPAAQRQRDFAVIYEAVFPHMYELIIDPFGNYLVQKMVGYCSSQQLALVLMHLKPNLFQISINQHGTRALQKLIDACSSTTTSGGGSTAATTNVGATMLNTDGATMLSNDGATMSGATMSALPILIEGLSPYIIDLIKDLNGNHVIQKILNKFGPTDCQFIYEAIIADLATVATHKHGCCVLQKCLNHVTQPQLTQFATAILLPSTFNQLINDQFGNYVVQYLILINLGDINTQVFANFVRAGVAQLCNLKFSLNVVEKFLKNCYANEVTNPRFLLLKFDLIYHILIYDLNKLINDPYGNYVVQTLIDIVINPHVQYLGPHGEFMVDKLALLLPQGYGVDDDTLQIAIIKTWFQKCKIVLLFGKRIQLKINIILNNLARPHPHLHQQPPPRHYGQRSSLAPHPLMNHHVTWAPQPAPGAAPSAQGAVNGAPGAGALMALLAPWLTQGSYAVNMTANGEFVADYSLPPLRSLSVLLLIAGGAPLVVLSADGRGAVDGGAADFHVGGHARQVLMALLTDTTNTLGHRLQLLISLLPGAGLAPLAPLAPFPQLASAYTVLNPLLLAALLLVWHPQAPAHHSLLAPTHSHYGGSDLLAPLGALLLLLLLAPFAMAPMALMAPHLGLAPALAPNLGTGYHHRHSLAFDQLPLFP